MFYFSLRQLLFYLVVELVSLFSFLFVNIFTIGGLYLSIHLSIYPSIFFICFLFIFLVVNKITRRRLLKYLSVYLFATRVLRMEQKRIPKKGLRWNPPSKRKQERPKMTLRKTFEGDFKKMELTLGTAERGAKERHSWIKRNSCTFLNV